MNLLPSVNRISLPITFKIKDNCKRRSFGNLYSQTFQLGTHKTFYSTTLNFTALPEVKFRELITFIKEHGSGESFQIQWLHVPDLDVVNLSPGSFSTNGKNKLSFEIVQKVA